MQVEHHVGLIGAGGDVGIVFGVVDVETEDDVSGRGIVEDR